MPSLYELQQLGPQPTNVDPVHQKAAAIHEAHDAAVAKIRADGTLSLAGRQQAMAPIHVNAKRQLAELQAQAAADKQAHIARLHRQSFGVPADPISAMSLRDAQARAAEIDNPATADWTMARALQYGDTLQAQALAQHSIDHGWSGPVSRFVEANPKVGDALTELNAISAGHVGQRLADAAAFWTAKPAEFGSMQDHEIERLAAARDGN